MKHVMLDAYGAEENQSNNLMHINQIMSELAFVVGLEPIAPPQLIPYYYGKVKEDVGISSFQLLKGGHVTLHTFPLRECYFVDCVSEKDFDTDLFKKYFQERLHYDPKKSNFQVADRLKAVGESKKYTPLIDFGPHYMARIKTDTVPTMETFFNFLENVVDEINMDEITRAVVLKDRTNDPSYLSGIIIIAQSHISIHYSYADDVIYADCFSCAPFDFNVLDKAFNKLGKVLVSEIIPRGTKHLYKVKSKVEEETLLANTSWQRVVKGEKNESK